MFFEEKKNYVAPALSVEKFEAEEIMSASSTTYEVEESPGWIPGWF